MISLKSQKWISILGLFSSGGTLICCAIPATLVAIGAGASLAGLVTALPQIVWLSENKTIVFCLAGILIAISSVSLWLNRNAPCPLDPKLAAACKSLRKWSLISTSIAVIFYLTGATFAFLLPALLG